MLRKIAGFEFKYQLRSPGFILIFLIFFLLTFLATSIDQVTIGGGGNVKINSPYALTQVVLIMSIFGLFIPTTILVNGVLRDTTHKMDGIIFSTPISKAGYLLGRFSGAFPAVMLAFASVPLGVLIGSMMPWVDPETVGPFRLLDYIYGLFVIGLPNMLITGMIMFVVANLTRSNIATYIALVVFLAGYLTGQSLLNDPELRTVAALTDPFGVNAFGELTRNWTAFERNEQLAPLTGIFLINRLLWLGIGIFLLILNYFLFSFRKGAAGRKVSKKKETSLAQQRFLPTTITLPAASRVFNSGTARKQFVARTGFEVRSVIFSVTFWVLLALGMFNTVFALLNTGAVFGTPTYPVTRVMIDIILGAFSIVPIVIVVFYAADLMWRDRSVKMHEIIDATPVPNWALMFPKFIALLIIIFTLFVISAATAITIQLFKGHTNIELDQYALRLLVVDTGWGFALVAVLAIFTQVLFNNRYVGILAMVIYIIGSTTLSQIGFEHNLYLYGGTPPAPYSDMNGYGHFLSISTWFNMYWTFVAIILLTLSFLLWNRGALTSIFRRIRDLPSALTPLTGSLLGASTLGAMILGGFIFYNTNILNEYVTQKDQEKIAVDYEEKYRPSENALQPKITDVKIDVDIYPYQRRFDAAGRYVIQNKTSEPISRIHVEYAADLKIVSQKLDGAAITETDDKHNVFIFETETPMQPGEKRSLSFETALTNPGFKNSNNGVTVVYNGTFINNLNAAPAIGYNAGRILTDRNTRRRHGLEPVDRLPKLEDKTSHSINYLRGDSDYVTFEATVSTVEGQTAIAPGYLEKEWVENGRRYFSYKMDTPILNFFSFQSAEYEIRNDKWEDVDLQVFYHKPHDFNVDRMIDAMKKSLAYFSENFSPFQYRQMRILEFPSYRQFAQSFPNTVPYSEAIGFILDTRDADTVDSVFYVTSHELAHQWWAHQVMGAQVQGGTMLVETFAQYSAFMAVEKEFGEEHVRDFLKLELDRYLASRGGERIEELPLYRVENQQYIHYQKGSLVMYALKDYVGEEVVNRSLARLIELRGFKSDPYAISTDFLTILREEAGPAHDDLITDLFEKITLFDLTAEEVKVVERDDGRFDVTLTYSAEKFYADGEGRETSAGISIPIDIGVFMKSPADEDFSRDDVLYLKKHTINPKDPTITVTVDKKPDFAGIDPYIKLIDRDSDDNVKRAS